MAQIIKHRRGLIGGVKNLTARNGELIIASGSISDLAGPFVFIGSPNALDEGVAGAFNSVSKLYTGTAVPTITAATYGSALDGTPFYASGDKSLYILNNSNVGNSKINLTGNIEGNTISGVTINKLQSTTVSASFFTGSFKGDGTALYNVPASGVTGLELNQIGQGSVTASITEAGGLRINTNTEVTGTLKVTGNVTVEQNLFVSGNIHQTGSFFTQGNVILSGSINIGNNLTGDTINFGGEVSSSIIPAENNSFDLGSTTNAWNDLYVSGTAYIENISLAGISVNSLALPGNLTVTGTTILSGSVSLEDLTNNRVVIVGTNGLLEDDANFTFDGTTLKVGDGDFEVGVSTGNIRTSGSLLVKSGTTVTGSLNVSGSANVVGPVDIKGNTRLTGSLFATNIVGTGSLYLQPNQTDVRYFEIYNSGASDVHIKSSNGLSFFGDDINYLKIDDSLQTATIVGINGVIISSSLNVTGSAQFSSTINVDGESTLASVTVEDLTQDRIVTVGVGGSLIDSSGFTYNGTVLKIGNGKFEVDTNDGDIRTSGSLTTNGLTNNGDLTVNGVLTVTGNTQLQANLYVSGNLEVLGSSTNVTIQSQTVNIGDNIIQVNAYSPFDRYAGLSAYDSGSVGLSGSVLWDSTSDYWLIVNSNSNSSKLIGTTASTGGTGTEISLTSGTFPIASASNTIGDSLLIYSGTTLAFNTNKFTIDSGTGATAISGNLTLSSAGGSDGGTKTSRVTFRNSSNVLGYVSTTETTNELDGILGYNHTSGVLEFSTLIDGGTY
jgi:cytoskeletal protein CcmA (bactofilin family)